MSLIGFPFPNVMFKMNECYVDRAIVDKTRKIIKILAKHEIVSQYATLGLSRESYGNNWERIR